jgi:Protein of unknown function (DUF2971)
MAIKYLEDKKRFIIDSYGKYFSDVRINSVFCENKIRFTPPNEFNDPLEFNPILKGNNLHDSYIYQDRFCPSKADIISRGIIGYLSENYGILSLTKVPDSYYMWSMYSNGHKGLFIVFKDDFNFQPSLIDGEQHWPIKKVNYTNNYYLDIEVDYIDLKYADNLLQANFDKIVFAKLKRWINENEYRMAHLLKNDKNKLERSLFDFDLNYISDIVFGASMSIGDKFRIIEKCEAINVKFYQATIAQDAKDYENKLGKIFIWKIPENISWKELKWANASHFCSNLEILKGKEIKISQLEDLPYPPERIVERK